MHFPSKATACAALAAAMLTGWGACVAATPSKQPAASAAAAPAQESAAKKSGSYGVKLGGFFSEDQRKSVKQAISQKYAKAKTCPPGMERENKKGPCAAPVKGHYWAVGQSLQAAVTTYPVPAEMTSALPPAPAGYKYVLAGEDILLVSDNGINLVVDLIEDVMG